MSTTIPILDLVIGLFFIFFLLSIVTSSAVETVLTIGRARAKILENWLLGIFTAGARNADGTPAGISVGQAIMDHCLTTARSSTKRSTPYISAANFVTAMLDKVTIKDTSGSPSFQPPPATLHAYIAALTTSDTLPPELKRTFLAFAHEAEAAAPTPPAPAPGVPVTQPLPGAKTSLDLFRAKLEAWFDDTKDRFTDKLKQGWTTWLTAVLGAIVVMGANADSVRIAKYLYDHKAESKRFADSAIAHYTRYENRLGSIAAPPAGTPGDTIARPDSAKAPAPSAADIKRTVDSLKADITALKSEILANIPMGWDAEGGDPKEPFWKKFSRAAPHRALGWIVSILAVMLGAPFWFDMLNKLANVRGAGPKPASTTDLERRIAGTDKK